MTHMKHQCENRPSGAAVDIMIPRDAVPEFLMHAHELACAGRSDEALLCLTESNVQQVRDQAGVEGQIVLGHTWRMLGRAREAAECYEYAAEEQPDPVTLTELAGLYRDVGRFSQALQCCEKALLIQADWPELRALHATCLIKTGKLRQGLELLKEIVAAERASAQVHSGYLTHLLYLPEMDASTLLHEHCAWARVHAPTHLARTAHSNVPDPQRRLKIGYVSADFRDHSVAYNFEALLDGRNAETVAVYGYGSVAQPDEVTERLSRKFDLYRDISQCDDETSARIIQEDGIDILVSIGGHTSGHRLRVLAYKPAPIQVDYHSVVTTGMRQIDYRFTDELLDPPQRDTPDYVEQALYVPQSVISYTAPAHVPPVGGLPAQGNGFVTFGSFANHVKINERVIAMWSAILRRVPRSRLRIKCPGGYDACVVAHLTDQFVARGIERERIRIRGWVDAPMHWDLYRQIDLALDTYPFNGCLTILEAAWMGVPTLSLTGDKYVSRMGKAILTHIGLGSLAVTEAQQFVEKGVALAHDPVLLAKLRVHLRPAMQAGPLCDSRRLAGELEKAYRRIWQQWCERQSRCV